MPLRPLPTSNKDIGHCWQPTFSATTYSVYWQCLPEPQSREPSNPNGMRLNMAVQISIYLNESDEWQRRPMHLQILNYLRQENVAGATVIHAVAGFTGRSR